MDYWNNISYRYQNNMEDKIKVPKGIVYAEKTSIFGRKTKEVRITFGNSDKKRRR